MSSRSLAEEINNLEAFLEFEDFIPFVVTDPNNCVNIEEYVEGPVLPIDLSSVKAGDIKEIARKINSGDFRVVLFKNIDNIKSRKDKDAWLAIIVTALKGESCYVLLNDKDLDEVYMPFKKLKAICTCSQYPDYLRKRMNLGKGPDFSHFTIKPTPKTSMEHSSEKNAVSKLDDTSYESNSKMNKKEIDWEERHFQICLAMLSCPVSDSAGMIKAPVLGDIIARADRMIDLLKQKYADEAAAHESIANDGTELEGQSESKSDQKPAKHKKGLWMPRIRQSEQFSKIWKALQTQGFSRGDDIPYFHIDEACQEADVDINDIDINKFEETFGVNIG